MESIAAFLFEGGRVFKSLATVLVPALLLAGLRR